MIQIFLLLLISILPVFLLGLFIYMRDKDKEPFGLLIKLFFGGILSCILVLIISALMDFIPLFASDREDLNLFQLFINVFIGIALVEEFSKWLFAFLFSYKHKAFDQFYDMLIYCAFVALGFACIENILYVFSGGLGTGIMRAFMAVPGHVCDGIFMGYNLGLAKINALNGRKGKEKKYIFFSLLVPTIAHGIYDYCLMSENIFLILLFFLLLIAMYVFILIKIKKVSSINRKMKYKHNFCTRCGTPINSNYCTVCGIENE